MKFCMQVRIGYYGLFYCQKFEADFGVAMNLETLLTVYRVLCLLEFNYGLPHKENTDSFFFSSHFCAT